MGWIVICGVDRSGKSTIGDYYKKLGYEYIHFSAPDKKYSAPGYIGPSYLDEIVELLTSKSGQNVIFDRSWYGERIWPYVYGRDPLLYEDDIDIIRELESNNNTRRILMVDTDEEFHWRRCVENNEPLTRKQFNLAYSLYFDMADKYNFEVLTLPKFLAFIEDEKKATSKNFQGYLQVEGQVSNVAAEATVTTTGGSGTVQYDLSSGSIIEEEVKLTPEQEKLERANAINSILKSKRLFKQQGWQFDEIENKVRDFLNDQLGDLLGMDKPNTQLSPEDIKIVKDFISVLKKKQEKQ
jgi:dephospho-CoA kinase